MLSTMVCFTCFVPRVSFTCLVHVLVDPPEQLGLRELEVVARGRLEEDLARLVGGAEAEGVSLVHRGVLHLVDRLHPRVRELAPPSERKK